MPSLDGGDNFVWIGDPFEGFGMGVMIVEEAIDRGLEVGDGSEDSAFEAAFGEGREETFNGVEPGGRGRREVEGPSRIAPTIGARQAACEQRNCRGWRGRSCPRGPRAQLRRESE